MAIIDLTAEEQAALTSGYQRGALIQFASECKELASKIQRDLIGVATRCKALLAANKHPSVAVEVAINSTFLSTDLGRFSGKMDIVIAAAQAIYGYLPEETLAIHKVMSAGVSRILNTTEETILADVDAVLEQFLAPPSIWS